MEKKLKKMFDYQRFSGNADLDRMLAEAEGRYPAMALSDEDLDLVAGGMNRRITDDDEEKEKKREIRPENP